MEKEKLVDDPQENMISNPMTPKRQQKKKRWMFPLVGVLIALSLASVIMVIYFQSHFFITARANGVSIGMLSVAEAADKLEQVNTKGIVTVNMGDYEEKIELPKKYEITEQYLEDRIGTTSFELPINQKYKEELVEKLNTLVIEEGKPSEDARIENVAGQYQIIPEVQGTVVNKEELINTIVSDVEANTGNYVYDVKDFYKKPLTTKDNKELNERLSLMKKRENKTITLQIKDQTQVLTKEEIQSFIDEQGNVQQDVVYAWVEQTNKNYGTIFQPVYFTNVHGETKKYKNNGSYGWDINMPKTRDLIVEALNSDKNQETISVPLDGDTSITNNTVTKNYIEIDLNNQKMYFFKDGVKVVDTDVITGRYNKGTATVPGFHTILYKDTDTKLEGEMLDGSKYSVPVKYWMPLKSYGGVVTQIGIHDADYKSEHFGNKEAYKTNLGSNGCINTPGTEVAKIFNNIEAGFPVIIYGDIYDSAPGEYDKPVDKGEAA